MYSIPSPHSPDTAQLHEKKKKKKNKALLTKIIMSRIKGSLEILKELASWKTFLSKGQRIELQNLNWGFCFEHAPMILCRFCSIGFFSLGGGGGRGHPLHPLTPALSACSHCRRWDITEIAVCNRRSLTLDAVLYTRRAISDTWCCVVYATGDLWHLMLCCLCDGRSLTFDAVLYLRRAISDTCWSVLHTTGVLWHLMLCSTISEVVHRARQIPITRDLTTETDSPTLSVTGNTSEYN